jgi:hypothetical protein
VDASGRAVAVIVVCVVGMALVVARYGVDSAAAVASLVASLVAVGAALLRWVGGQRPLPAAGQPTPESPHIDAVPPPRAQPSPLVRRPGWWGGVAVGVAGLLVVLAVWRPALPGRPNAGASGPGPAASGSNAASQRIQSVAIDKGKVDLPLSMPTA